MFLTQLLDVSLIYMLMAFLFLVYIQSNNGTGDEVKPSNRVAGIEDDTAEKIYSLVSRSADDEFSEGFFRDPVRWAMFHDCPEDFLCGQCP